MSLRRELLCLAVCLQCFAAAPLVASTPGGPVVTNKSRFRIPFKFNAEALQRMNARELRLYVSSDQERNWELAQSISPQAGKFEFQAPGDGEYRFCVKTLDARNQLHPSSEVYETGLIVVVDMSAPALELTVQQIAPGRVEMSWQAIDSNLDVASLRLEYRQPGLDDWQVVSVAPRGSGQTSWSIPQGGIVAVRGTIADTAGNVGSGQNQAQINGPGAAPPPVQKPDLRQPIAANQPATPERSPLGDRFIPGTSSRQPAPPIIAAPNAPLIAPAPQVVERTSVVIPPGTRLITENPEARPDITKERWSEPAAPPQFSPTTTPAASRERVVTTKRFQIGYKIDDVGPSGLGSVELFITQDQGQSWFKYGDDPDHQSPFEVEVPEDGEYGFAIRARSGVGLSIDPPAAGEQPAFKIVVDQTPPTLEMLPIRQGQGAQVNQLQLRWKMADAHPSDKPISIYVSGSANGSWESISGWRADTGEFVWTVGAGAPPQLYFKVVARDAGGNTVQAVTPRPIIVDFTRPTARIVDIELPSSSGPQ